MINVRLCKQSVGEYYNNIVNLYVGLYTLGEDFYTKLACSWNRWNQVLMKISASAYEIGPKLDGLTEPA